MQTKNIIIPGLLYLSTIMSCAQTDKGLTRHAEVDTIEDSHFLLKNQMTDSLYQAIEGRHVKRSKRLIKTKKEAIELGKQAFLKEFGKDYTLEERRYMAHLIKGFWIVKGLQPHGFTGGTVVIIIDSESGELYRTLYWK